jgi:hypothetical protein
VYRPLSNADHDFRSAACIVIDTEFDCERNHQHIQQVHHMNGIIPANVVKSPGN